MTKIEKEMAKLKTYRVYGHDGDENIFDEYCQAMSAQHAVDRVREWYSDREGIEIEEVAKVVKGWK